METIMISSWVPAEVAESMTYADLQPGDFFECLEYDDGIVWEKRERRAICWDGEIVEAMDFKPTDEVRKVYG